MTVWNKYCCPGTSNLGSYLVFGSALTRNYLNLIHLGEDHQPGNLKRNHYITIIVCFNRFNLVTMDYS